jgi:hypothetical protein
MVTFTFCLLFLTRFISLKPTSFQKMLNYHENPEFYAPRLFHWSAFELDDGHTTDHLKELHKLDISVLPSMRGLFYDSHFTHAKSFKCSNGT